MYCAPERRRWDGSVVYSFCGSSRGSDVEVTFKVWTQAHLNVRTEWDMSLYRKVGGEWVLGGTRSGYVSNDSPSNRTFTNVRSGEIMVVVYPRNEFFSEMSFIIPNH